MATHLLRTNEKHIVAVRRVRRAQAELDDANRGAAATKAERETALRKRRVEPSNEKAVDDLLWADTQRSSVDDAIRIAMKPLSEAWIRINVDGPFRDDYCYTEEDCVFKNNLSRLHEFSYFMESIYNKDNADGRYCNDCFAKVKDKDADAKYERDNSDHEMRVEVILRDEARDKSGYTDYTGETAEARANRAHIADEWRTLALPLMMCSLCDGGTTPATRCLAEDPAMTLCDSVDVRHKDALDKWPSADWITVARFRGCIECRNDTPATHFLVGCPTIRLCNVHFSSYTFYHDRMVAASHMHKRLTAQAASKRRLGP